MFISKATINNQPLEFSKLNILIGSNGAGKTTLLRDLRSTFIEKDSQSDTHRRWQTHIAEDNYIIEDDDWRTWIDNLSLITGRRYSYTSIDGDAYGVPQCVTENDTALVQGRLANALKELANPSTQQVLDLLKNPGNHFYRQHADSGTNPLAAIKDQYSSLLDVDSRLMLSQSTNGILDLDQIQNLAPAPKLAMFPKAIAAINKTLLSMFDKRIFIEQSQKYDYDIYVASSTTKPPKRYPVRPGNILKIRDELNNWIHSNNVTKLKNEGHGIRAAVRILCELEISLKKIIFIDEPELHLYPHSKYLLGKHISNFCATNKKQIFVATHDTELLRGLVESHGDLQIIKIHPGRSLTQCQPNSIKSTVATDSLRASFADATIIVEGIVDKFVYSEIIRRKHMLDATDYAIISEDGKSNIWKDHKYLSSLNMRIAYIIDFDALLNNKNSPAAIFRLLDELDYNENCNVDEIKTQIDILNNTTKGMQNRRKGLKLEAPNETISLISGILCKLEGLGIFICPNGELEDWISKEKTVDLTPEKIVNIYMQGSNSKYSGLTTFLKKISTYLTA